MHAAGRLLPGGLGLMAGICLILAKVV